MPQNKDDTSRKGLATWTHWDSVKPFFTSCLGITPCKVIVKKEQAEKLKIFGFMQQTENNGEVTALHPGTTRTTLETLWRTGIPLKEITVTL
jgi:hypothetical protein